MGKIVNAYIMPHPPILAPGIGQGRERNAVSTVEAMKRAAREIAKDKPTTIVLSTPHAPCFRDYVYIEDSERIEGDFGSFGHPDVGFSGKNNRSLAALIADKAEHAGISAGGLNESQKKQYGISGRIDHGALVPLCFITRELEEFRLVVISTPFLPFQTLYDFGNCVREAVQESDERVIYLASADLSHRLTRDAPAGYHPAGREYDDYLIDKICLADVETILKTDERFLEKAGECGTRSIIIMFGALHGRKLKPEIYSYEGPFGVGYLVAKMNVADNEPDRTVTGVNTGTGTDRAGRDAKGEADGQGRRESDYVRLARETLETYVREGNKLDVPRWVPQEFKTMRAGVFVSLKKDGMLRGCIGTIGPVRANIAEEIINNAISAGTQDPRFSPVKSRELNDLVYSVDVLGPPEKIRSMEKLDVKRYGVIVTCGLRRGLLLPDLEGVDTPEQQVGIALQKAGIKPSERYEMERFEVRRYR